MNVRAIVSENNKRIPPINADAGIKNLWRPGKKLRVMWGTINPTNPIIPQRETINAVYIEVKTKNNSLVALTLTPDVVIVSSGRYIISSSLDEKSKTIINSINIMDIIVNVL